MRHAGFTLIVFVSTLILLAGCSRRQPTTLGEAMALYHQNKLEQALPLFEQLVEQDVKSDENRVWLAETYRRLGKKEEAVKTARLALDLNPRSSFAHTVIAEASNPVLGEWWQANSDTTWVHLMKAVECDSTDGHPWLVIWGEAMHRGEYPLVGRALSSLVASRFLTRAALAYGRWMLAALPNRAILLTNGDMDTYPPCALQEVEGFRKDVVIVNRGTLETKWHARYVRDIGGVPLPLDGKQLEDFSVYRDGQGRLVTLSDEIVRRWLKQKAAGSLDRPLCFAVTVDPEFLAGLKNDLQFAGVFYEWRRGAANAPDTAAMHMSLEGSGPDDFTGLWVSERDRSPIRRLYTKNIVRNVTETAIAYGELLIAAKRFPAAIQWIAWADKLDQKAELGPVFSERIAVAKGRIAEKWAGR